MSATPPTRSDLYAVLAQDDRGAVRALARDMAAVEAALGTAAFEATLVEKLHRWLNASQISLFEFRLGLQPRCLFSDGVGHDLRMVEYLGGVYLLDPFYDIVASGKPMGVFRLSQQDNRDLVVEGSFKRYWSQVGGQEEVGLLTEFVPGRVAHISAFLKSSDAITSEGAVAMFRAMETTIAGFYARQYAEPGDAPIHDETTRRRVHEAVSAALNDFGRGVLTERELEIVPLLLKGHSAKSAARILGISPGTVGIHRSNIYRKMGYAGQGDLFAAFVAEISGN